jgi:serine/threonine protein kinase
MGTAPDVTMQEIIKGEAYTRSVDWCETSSAYHDVLHSWAAFHRIQLDSQLILSPLSRWSFGILIYEMLVGLPPFYSDNVAEMYEKICGVRWDSRLSASLSAGIVLHMVAARMVSAVRHAILPTQAPIDFPDFITEDEKQIIRGLLNRDPKARLGTPPARTTSGQGGAHT